MEHQLAMFGLGLPGGLDAPMATPFVCRLPGPAELPPGAVVGDRYLIEVLLKHGDNAGVYRARDTKTGRVVKLKRLATPGVGDEREAGLLGQLNHPGIPRALESFDEDGCRCYVQTYLAGPTVRETFKATGPLPPDRLEPLLRASLNVLDYLHTRPQPVLHRDIKPANMVVLADGSVGLIDFGIAREGVASRQGQDLDDLTEAHTTGYAPPEQVIGLEAYPASDLYALAVSLVYAATDLHPVFHWDAKRARVQAPARVGKRLKGLLDWMLAPALDDRCPSAREALAQLNDRRKR